MPYRRSVVQLLFGQNWLFWTFGSRRMMWKLAVMPAAANRAHSQPRVQPDPGFY